MNWFVSTALETIAAAVILIPLLAILEMIRFHSIKKMIAYAILSLYLAAIYTVTGLPNITYLRPDASVNLLPLLCSGFRSAKSTVAAGLGTTLLIELLQIFTYRATDINDILTNTAGAFIGYSIAAVLLSKVPQTAVTAKRSDVYFIGGMTFAVMFFMQPFLSSPLWNILL